MGIPTSPPSTYFVCVVCVCVRVCVCACVPCVRRKLTKGDRVMIELEDTEISARLQGELPCICLLLNLVQVV